MVRFANDASDAGFRVLIAEEALRTPKGHWGEYIRTIAQTCREAGDEVTVLAHRDASPEIIGNLHATPWLSRSAWEVDDRGTSPLVRYANVLLHNIELQRRIAAYFHRSEKFDCVLAPTILIHHLLAWTALAHRFAGKKFDRLTLIFVNGQGIYQGPGNPVLFPRHPKRTLFRKTLRSLRPLIERDQVVLGVETEAMKQEFETFCGLPFRRFPHPVDFPAVNTRRSIQEPAPLFACLGFARYEKGSDLLQEAIIEVRKRRPDLKIRFLIQWLDDFVDPAGNTVRKDFRLTADPDVEFITDPIGPERYLQELGRAYAAVLPYRASSYCNRVSRVAIEAAITGLPILYTRHTWIEEMVGKCGAGIAFTDGDREDLVEKIILLAEQLPVLRQQAAGRREMARRLHSGSAFRETLLDGLGGTEAPAAATPYPTAIG